MKIAQLVCAFPPYAGGIGNSAKRLEEIISQKYEIETFHPDNANPVIRRGHGAFIPQLLWRLKKFDTIYLHYPFFGVAEVIWLFSLFNKNKRLIVHYHMDVKNISHLTKLLSLPSLIIRKSLLKRADIIVTASLDYIKHSQISSFYAKHPDKFKEIPFGVDLEKFKPKELHLPSQTNIIAKAKDLVRRVNDLFIKKDKLELIFVGGLDSAHYFKGVEILIKALSIIEHKNWHLKIVGDGDRRPIYENLAIELNIANRVEFAGKLSDEDMIRSLQTADALILPSINTNEAFGLVLIEALACGLPVIASDLPGVRRVFQEGQEGLLVRPGEISDLAEKIDALAANPNKRQEMAKAARRLAERKYSLEKMERSYEDLLAQ